MSSIENIINSTKKNKKNFKNVGIEEDIYSELQIICNENKLSMRPFINNILKAYLQELHNKKD